MTTTILCADDDPIFRALLERLLTNQGYEVITAADGKEAIKAARKFTPDLIMIDFEMPEMNGIEAVKIIRQVHATMHTPIIMLTSMASLSDMQTGYEAGVDDYLTKPFEPNQLTLRVEAMLRRINRTKQSVQEHETRTIGVFSLRGGTGCTGIAVNLALGLTKLWDRPAALIDLATPMGSVDLFLNLRTKNHIGSLIQHEEDIDSDLVRDYLVTHESGLRVLTGLRNPIDAERLTENLTSLIIDSITEDYLYTVIDLPHSFNAVSLAALDRLDQLVLVFTPDIVSIREITACLTIFGKLGFDKQKIQIIINWVMPKGGIQTARIEKTIKRNVLVTIPHVADVWNQAVNLGQPVILSDPSHPSVQQLEDLTWHYSTITDQSRTDGHTEMRNRIAERHAQRKSLEAQE